MGEDEVFEFIATEFTFSTIYTTSLFSYSLLSSRIQVFRRMVFLNRYLFVPLYCNYKL